MIIGAVGQLVSVNRLLARVCAHVVRARSASWPKLL